jgi:hypothetical protein
MRIFTYNFCRNPLTIWGILGKIVIKSSDPRDPKEMLRAWLGKKGKMLDQKKQPREGFISEIPDIRGSNILG